MTDLISNCWLLPSKCSVQFTNKAEKGEREREGCGIQTSFGQVYIYISHQLSMYTAIFITVCLHYTSICKHDTTITFAKKHRHQKAIPSFEPSQYLALTGSSGPEWPFVYKEKAFWLEWMLSSGRRHFLASILPSSIEIGTWPPKFCQWHVPVLETSHFSTCCHDYLEWDWINHTKCISTFPATWTTPDPLKRKCYGLPFFVPPISKRIFTPPETNSWNLKITPKMRRIIFHPRPCLFVTVEVIALQW